MSVTTIITITLLLLGYLLAIWSKYYAARQTGLRLIVSPITPHTLQWKIASALFRPLLVRFKWFRAIDWTCCWQDGDALHREFGLSFIVVSPGSNVLCSSDGRTIEHVFKKWRDFIKPDNVNEILGMFGPNVDMSNGDDWVRHRKLTAPCFSERASATVWSESLQQSEILLGQWLSHKDKKMNTMVEDTSTLALNVISSVAFENDEINKPNPRHTLSLRDTLETVISTSISPAMESVLPWLKSSELQMLLPTKIKKLLVAMKEFRQYSDETIARERAKENTVGENKMPTLISTLINANDEIKSDKDGVTKTRLSDIELRGNIFIFIGAGLEPTAITLSYALALLAIHPDIQAWVQEELDDMIKANGDDAMDYTSVFPKLKRVMAIMYETLRLYGPSPPLPRSPFPKIDASTPASSSPVIPVTNPKDSSLSSSITLPYSTQLMLNMWASQTSATHFPNPLTWDPRRWIQSSTKMSSVTDEKLLHPTSGSGFYAWGAGPRICPGMKFSQVEFCAVMSSILRKVRVETVTEDARERMLNVLKDSDANPLLLHLRRPEELELRIVER